jgi:hypothetical protein
MRRGRAVRSFCLTHDGPALTYVLLAPRSHHGTHGNTVSRPWLPYRHRRPFAGAAVLHTTSLTLVKPPCARVAIGPHWTTESDGETHFSGAMQHGRAERPRAPYHEGAARRTPLPVCAGANRSQGAAAWRRSSRSSSAGRAEHAFLFARPVPMMALLPALCQSHEWPARAREKKEGAAASRSTGGGAASSLLLKQ